MMNTGLATYLNNHLAGSVSALELLSSLETSYSDDGVAGFVAELRMEIEAEQRELEKLMENLQITRNKPQQAVGWLAEKFTNLKLRIDSSSNEEVFLLETLELILVGIEGKCALWRALAYLGIPGLPLQDYERYVVRSEEQKKRVEVMRLAAAQNALTDRELS